MLSHWCSSDRRDDKYFTSKPTRLVSRSTGGSAWAREPGGPDTPSWNGALTNPAAPGLIRAAGLSELVFNGGPMSDLYHWRTGTLDPLAATYHDTEPEARVQLRPVGAGGEGGPRRDVRARQLRDGDARLGEVREQGQALRGA